MQKQHYALLIILLLLLPVMLVSAQQETAPELVPGVDATGTLSSTNIADTYVFSGSTGDAITLDALTASTELGLVLQLIAPDGTIVVEDTDLEPAGEALIGNFSLPQDGQYIVNILRGSGAAGEDSGTYNLTLSGTLTPPPTAQPATESAPAAAAPAAATTNETVDLSTGGLEFSLQWTGAVNLNLEIRDPQGGAVFTGSGDSPSGGSLAEDVNVDCATATADNPTETITWQPGILPAGSYEIILYYLDGCTEGGPQQFTVGTVVDGGDPATVVGTLLPTQKYVTALEVNPDGTSELLVGGVNVGLDVSILSNQIANASPLPGTSVTGTINREQPAVAYTVDAVTGDTLTVNMDATSGSLDSYLIMLDPSGAEIARNDDRANGNTNSTITQAIATDGSYTIVATRYGQLIGGTEGNFNLNLSLQVTNATAATDITTEATDTATDGTTTADTTTDATTETDATTDTTTDSTTLPAATAGIIPATLPVGSVQVYLTWNTNADIQLLVRDPAGEAIYDDVPTSQSGGIQDQQGNARCSGTGTPVSYIYWPQSRLPRGIYEIDIWYQDTCDDPNPVTFNLIVVVEGQEVINEQQPTTPGSNYAITFEVDPNGVPSASLGGFFAMDDPSSIDYFSLLGEAEPLEYGDTIPGEITSESRVQIFGFEGTTGDNVRIAMQRTGGTLDTALFLISPEGIPLANNDDIVDPVTGERNTNSLIDDVTLTSTGTYYILATHYGLEYGGTIGTYNLTLTQRPPG